VIAKALAIVHNSMATDNIKIIEEYDDNTQIEMHDNEMLQVILNIFKNAHDNFKEKQIASPLIKVSSHDNTLFICDNGGGIPKDVLERIFDPYFSTKDEKNGTGLGLYMSKTIVEDHHHGKLRAYNQNDGVCFEINLENTNA
jgi:signal transduction histidine kinase